MTAVNLACADICLPRSQVSDRANSAGNDPIVAVRALVIVTAP